MTEVYGIPETSATRFCNPAGAGGERSMPGRAGRSRRSRSPARGLWYKNRSQRGSAKAMIVNLNKYK